MVLIPKFPVYQTAVRDSQLPAMNNACIPQLKEPSTHTGHKIYSPHATLQRVLSSVTSDSISFHESPSSPVSQILPAVRSISWDAMVRIEWVPMSRQEQPTAAATLRMMRLSRPSFLMSWVMPTCSRNRGRKDGRVSKTGRSPSKKYKKPIQTRRVKWLRREGER